MDRPRLHGGHARHIKPATPPRQPYKNKGTGHAPRQLCGTQGPATPPRRPHGHQGTGHAPTAVLRGPGDRPHPHGSHTGPRKPATPPRQRYGQQRTGHAPTAAIQAPGDRPRPNGKHTEYRGPTTLPRLPYKTLGIGHALRRPYGDQGTGLARTAAIGGPGDRSRPHGGHTWTSAPATPPRRPYKAY